MGLFEALNEITAVDPDYIQFCCAEWFWKRQVNSYALQLEPDRFKHQDTAILDYREALHVEKIRNEFIGQLLELWQKQQIAQLQRIILKVVALFVFTHVHDQAVGIEVAPGPLDHTADIIGHEIAHDRIDKNLVQKLTVFSMNFSS